LKNLKLINSKFAYSIIIESCQLIKYTLLKRKKLLTYNKNRD